MRKTSEKIHFFIPLLSMIFLVAFILTSESGLLSNLVGHQYSPAEQQISMDAESLRATNKLVKLYLNIQPIASKEGEGFLDRLIVNQKRKEIPVFFEDEEDFLKQELYRNAEENASLQVRKRSLNEPSYSYKLRLYDKAGLFLGQRRINIEKYLEDPLRIRNKLCMDLLSELEILEPLNIRFGQLYIKDSNEDLSNDYLNHGLYFLTEQIDKSFLTIHGLDPNGALYEIDNYDLESNNFKKAVNNNLERRGRNADKELEAVLEKINSNMPIEKVIEEHFDLNNLLDYMAFSILVDKEDPGEEDYMLYLSLKDEKWYIFSSSYRDSFGNSRQVKWKRGIHVFKENPLFDKIIGDEILRRHLIVRINVMYEKLKEIEMDKMIGEYEKVIMPHLASLPDYRYMEMPIAEFQERLYQFPDLIDQNYDEFTQSLEYPSPIRIDNDDSLIYWTPSISLVEADVYYNILVSEYPDFRSTALVKGRLEENRYKISGLPPGIYYVKVTVMDNQGYEQGAVNRYTDPFGKNYHGVRQVVIP